MSFLAQLTIDNTEIKVLNCQFGVEQPYSANGNPMQNPVGSGLVEMEVESTSNTNLYDWAISPDKKKSGCITFYRRDSFSRLKRLDFTDAVCVSYREFFNASGADPMSIRLKISARELKLEDVSVVNNWAAEKVAN